MRRRKGCSNASTERILSRGAGIAIAMMRADSGAARGPGRFESFDRRSAEPEIETSGDEGVVAEVGVDAQHPIDLLGLAGAQALLRVEAPDAFEQALAAQHL